MAASESYCIEDPRAPGSDVEAMARLALTPPIPQLPDDVWVYILNFSSLAEVLALRRTCRGFNSVSHLRAVWVNLARLDVLGNHLPRPAYATPLASVPTASLEKLVIRAVRLEGFWGHPEEPKAGAVRCVRRPVGSTSWLKLFRSRWMFVGSTDEAINVWDLDSPSDSPVLSHSSTAGYVESGELWVLDDGVVRLAVNTNKSSTTPFTMRLPHIGEPIPEGIRASNFVVESTFKGYTKILTLTSDIIGFSRSADYNQPHIVDYHRLTSACLDRSPSTLKAQSCVDMRLIDDLIVVAKDWCVELFSAAEIIGALSSGPGHGSILTLSPICAVPYPEGQMVWKVRILGQGLPSYNGSLDCSTVVSLAVYIRSGATVWTLWSAPISPDTSGCYEGPYNPHGFALDLEYGITRMDGAPTATDRDTAYFGIFEWGQTFRRYIFPHEGSRRLVRGAFSRKDDSPSTSLDVSDVTLWGFPRSGVPDVPRLGQFDDCAGIFALAMMSGRIWVLDMVHSGVGYDDWTKYEEASPPPRGGLNIVDQEDDGWILVSRLYDIEDLIVPPPGWLPGTPSGYTRHTEETAAELERRWYLIPQENIPKDWCNEWPNYLYIHEWEDYYGCAKTIFNDMFHVPGEPKLLLLRRHDPGHKRSVEVEGELFIFSEKTYNHHLELILGNPTLEEALAFLRGDLTLDLFSWDDGDLAARDLFILWGRVRYQTRTRFAIGADGDSPENLY